jgi:hypothetical protein
MKKNRSKLTLSKETLRSLDVNELEGVFGGLRPSPGAKSDDSLFCSTASQDCCSGCVGCD